MEERRLLAAVPVFIGATYLEEDGGQDLHGDTFEVKFEGGATGTELTRLVINGDHGPAGYSVGDMVFDTVHGGLGADDARPFTVVSQTGIGKVSAQVSDGGMTLTLDFQGFHAGEKLVFSIDVDELQDYDPNETDLNIINEGLDPIASGVEFQGSMLVANFQAPDYYDVSGQGEFRNIYDKLFVGSNLLAGPQNPDGLPGDDYYQKRDRSTGVGFLVQQAPIPASISGYVYHDKNDDGLRQTGETGLGGVQVRAVPLSTIEPQAAVVATTDANGFYKIEGLMPGTYRVVEVAQPANYYDGKDTAGTVLGVVVGAATNPGDQIDDVALRGGQAGVDYNFGELAPASIRGKVRLTDRDGDCDGPLSRPIADVVVQLFDADGKLVAQTKTDAAGEYQFSNLKPGKYRVVETTPVGLIDGDEEVGSAGGSIVANDTIDEIVLGSAVNAVDYNFCEHPAAQLSGYVYHDQNNNGKFDSGEAPIAGVQVTLTDAAGKTVDVRSTNAQGFYQFTGLAYATYVVTETQPVGWLDGLDAAGTVGGAVVGVATNPGDQIRQVAIQWGDDGVHYDFGELKTGSLEGMVFSDPDQDCEFGPNDTPLSGVVVQLLNAQGQVIATKTTGADGRYKFDDLAPGTYSVREIQPTGYFQGGQKAGSGGGVVSQDLISAVALGSGQALVHYDFCEIPPSSLEGMVFSDPDEDCEFGPNDTPLSGVTVQLLNSQGQVIATQTTGADGRYKFDNLAPGVYSVRELQPTGYFQGGQKAGSGGGVVSQDLISSVTIGGGQTLVHYDFCEIPPSSLEGMVFSDPDEDCEFGANDTPLSGVVVQLLNEQGQVIATQTTGADGRYKFDNLAPGVYSVRELQPSGYFQGGQKAGSGGGIASQDLISSIRIGGGQSLVHYDFCELPPATLEGVVYVDLNMNCTPEAGEQRLSGVTIRLFDDAGRLVATTQTDGAGHYKFGNLAPGFYHLIETQPTGYYQGCQVAGSNGGDDSIVDEISQIPIRPGEELIDYDFGELPPGSIRGIVHADPDPDCVENGNETPLAGVVIHLLNDQGVVVATTTTDARGEYFFGDLPPGVYSLVEEQPDGLFNNGQKPGSGGGDGDTENEIRQIVLGGGQHLIDYHFCEQPPSLLSGYVFQDGPVIAAIGGVVPVDLFEIRDGLFTADDTPIEGVVLELRNGINGEPIDADEALPGYYAPGPIRTTTGADGRYEFLGLRGGRNYAVYQLQPDEYLDSLDTPGTTSGIAINPNKEVNPAFITALAENPNNDAIIRIPLGIGVASLFNNFSEVRIMPASPPPPPDPPPSPLELPPPVAFYPGAPPTLAPIVRPVPMINPLEVFGGRAIDVTWHLSVIDAGNPRGAGLTPGADAVAWQNASLLMAQSDWDASRLRTGVWLVAANRSDDELEADGAATKLRELTFGLRNGIPLTGDFNGDGLCEMGVFYHGEWFIDLNGNGVWDEDDLWARLGGENDLPVVGDWNGDGKDDIGIFGPEWHGDARAIAAEPGLPDLTSSPKNKAKNVPPRREEATDGVRVLKLTREGRPRADLIDHVFRYGKKGDTPIAGDWDGDGIDTIGIFHDGQWLLDTNGDGHGLREGEGADVVAQFGQVGDIPVVGDFDGDGVDEIGVFRDGTWLIDINHNRELDAHDRVFEMGGRGDHPVVGDWNGDGVEEPGLYRDGGQPPSDAQARKAS